MSRGQPLITIKQLRAQLENLRIPKYKFCAVIDTHPSNLSNILSGKLPLPPDLARKILVALALEVVVMAEPRRAVLHLAAAADYLGTTPKALRCRIARGLVPYRSLGSRIIFVQQELDQFLLRLPGVSLDEARHNLEVRR